MRNATTQAVVAVCGILFAGGAMLLCAAPVGAQPIVQAVSGIGTTLSDVYGNGTNVGVSTSVSSVSYMPPRRVHAGQLQYHEVTGSIQGTGWGGEWQGLDGPNPIVDITSHYSYDIPFVLRWHPAWDGTLVYYTHGRTELALLTLAESLLGPANEGRELEHEGRFVSDVALTGSRRHAFFGVNVGGLRRDGGYSMHALEGAHAGEPVAGTVDAVTARDLARVAKRLLEQLAGRPVATTIGTGHSAGALIMQFLSGGQSMIIDDERFGQRLLTGGDYNTPYDPSSGRIFDAFVPFAPSDVSVNRDFPLAAPLLMIGGQAEFAGANMVLYARRLKRNGVDLDAGIRIYQVRNLPHNWAEIGASTPNLNQMRSEVLGVTPHADGDRMAPVVAAVLDRAREWTRGTPPPASRIEGIGIDQDGNGVADAIAFPDAGGGTSQLLPAVDDAAVDSYVGFQFDTAWDPVFVARYVEVLGALAHEPQALSLPGVTCRLGGFVIGEASSDSQLVPFADMDAHWKSYGQYRRCVAGAVKELAKTGLYDPAFAPDPAEAKPLIQ
jgi:hypothetical protein